MPTEISGSTGVNKIQDGTVVDADINSSAAIAGSKINGSFGKVLQVVSTTKTDTLASTASSYTDVTGVSATITPSSTSSKIYVVITTGYSISSTGYGAVLQVVRGSTAIGGGTASGNKSSSFSTQTSNNTEHFETASYSHLDSPNTTSATTYKLQALVRSGATIYFGRTASDRDDSFMGRTSSTITLMEIAG